MAALSIALSLIVRCDSRRARADRCLTCLDGKLVIRRRTLRSLLMALAG
jgi:hypothetical protein